MADGKKSWVILLEQELTTQEAQDLGKVIGKAGFQGRFLSGNVADHLKKSIVTKGEEHGEHNDR